MIDAKILDYIKKKYALKFNSRQHKDLIDFMTFINDNVDAIYSYNEGLELKSERMLTSYGDLCICINLKSLHSFNYSDQDFYEGNGFTILDAEDFIIKDVEAIQQKESIMSFLFER